MRVFVLAFAVLIFAATGLLVPDVAGAVEAVRVAPDAAAIDLTPMIERYRADGDLVQISTAPGRDGIVRRIAVKARETGSRSEWIAFALTNSSDEQIERLLVTPHFRLIGSGLIWPDLGSTRIAAITASEGIRPEREPAPDADLFQITLDPGTTVTFVAELASPNIGQVYLWEAEAYKGKVNGLLLYKGIIIGIAGLLALFLTIVFVVKGALIFPAAAALAWAVLGYACIDFGFFQRLFPLGEVAERVYRAGAEAVLAATLLVFLFAYLNLNRWHVRYSHVGLFWLVFLAALVGLAIVDPPIAAGVARISIAALAVVGLILILHLALHGFDRAIMLVPTWLLLDVWVLAASFTVLGRLQSDLAQPALIGGLVLIVMLIGFTVMQHAFAGVAFAGGALSTDAERRAMALSGSGDVVFDWDVPADAIFVSPELEHALGHKRGGLGGGAADWMDHVHVFDRDRFRSVLDAVIENRRGRLGHDFRLRSVSGHTHWYRLKARPVVGPDGEVVRVIGTMTDVTDSKSAEERLLHDAVHDNLTGLPNRQLFLDRLEGALTFPAEDTFLPTVIVFDLDRYKQVNEAIGHSAGDQILLTLARRLGRLLRPQDTLARVAGDEFAVLLLSEQDEERIQDLEEQIRQTISTPITHSQREIFLTASIGHVRLDRAAPLKAEELLRNAEVALTYAKRLGGNRIEVYHGSMRQTQRGDRLGLESDLRRAVDRGEMRVAYQPIVRLEDRTIAGFEALLRWNHPRLGPIGPQTFIPVAEETGLIVDLGIFAMDQAAAELSAWQRALDVDPPIFASVNVSSRQLLKHDLLHDLKTVLARSAVTPGSLKLELTESLVMENPEYAAQILNRIRDLGAGLSLDDFGTGFSALSYLQKFPFDTIKIDQSFVRELTNGRPVILRSIVKLAEELGMDVVAEGAETETEAIELYHLGCNYAQGFVFGEPMSSLQARRLVGAAAA